uniref:HEAT repeat-containing protein 5A n=5 Tax=Hirondellea gigas TaxID=1518452 RepID=A0A6A7FSQ7_9CRUS
MMELSHSLTLNEEALQQLPAAKRPIFVFEWLRFLNKVLGAANKSDIKGCQQKLVSQLVSQMAECPGPPTRQLVAHALATLFSVGDTYLLFETSNKCNDVLKNKDDSPSYLPTRLASVTCIGAMYEKLGRMMGRSYEDTVQILLKTLRNAESQLRIQIMITLEKITAGMGTAAANVHKDVYKAAKVGLTDRAMPVRRAAAMCLLELSKHAPFLYTSELENLCQLCYRSLESSSSYDTRCSIAKLLGSLLATTQNPPKEVLRAIQSGGKGGGGTLRLVSLEEALGLLSTGFLRGGNSFLKGTGEMIKGASAVARELRVGITQAYVVLVQELGSLWLEKNVPVLLAHLTELIANPKATTSHVDAVYSRKCVNFIMRSTLGRMLGEKAQAAACKELTHIIVKNMNAVDVNSEGGGGINSGGEAGSQHVLVCMLQELGSLVVALSTSCSSIVLDPHLNLVDAVISVVLHPSFAARLSAAWCLQCISVALPSQLHPLITRCCNRIDALKSSPEAIAGYSCAIAALIGCVRKTPLGIPHVRGKVVFNIAEELLRSASQNSRLSLHRTQAGWLIIGSVMTLGVGVVKGLLPRMLLLWKNSFPRSNKEIESEKARGDAFTWQVTLEGRAGALSSMYSFLLHCPELAGEDTIRRLLLPIEAALLMLSSITNIVKQYGQHLKASAAMVRLRLYQVLLLLPPQSYESHYSTVLKLLVSEFTLAESGANTSTSLMRSLCQIHHAPLLSPSLHHPDHNAIEEQLQSNSASGSGALEHDPTWLYRATEECNEPLPLGVAVIDASVTLFGQMFPQVAGKHRLKMLNLFIDMIRASKSQRQEAVQTNILTAVLLALRKLTDVKGSLGQEDVKKAATTLLMDGLSQANPLLRCASGEAIGRMAQVVGDPHFVASLAQTSFDKLRSARDATSRTGHSLALGCLHRCVGSMGSSHHLSTSISILLALARDTTAPVVQVWALHALSMIADSGGPMFRSYVEPALNLLLDLLLITSSSEVQHCIGKCLQALITTIGPELQGSNNAIVTARWSLLCGCGLVQQNTDPFVQAEAVTCLQQMHMFAPRHVNLSSLVPMLVHKLSSNHLLLRRAAVSCLRQLAQREAWEVCHHVLSMTSEENNAQQDTEGSTVIVPESGLPGLLFSLLDCETDPLLVSHAQHTLLFTLHALAPTHLRMWLTLCREVLTNAQDATGDGGAEDGGDPTVDDEDLVQFHASIDPDPHPALPPRWKSRVFAAQCVAKIILECGTNLAHFDLVLARELQQKEGKGEFLVLHLSELIRMGFMAATSESDQLRLEGLNILQLVIDKFARSPEPEFPGHVILEQYQAQVGAALRPAFATDTASHVTARACEVCSTWIGSGVARDLNDLRRVHQLLVSSLDKLHEASTKGLYNESAATLEKLAILKAWAEVYIVSQKGSLYSSTGDASDYASISIGEENLGSLVAPELKNLSRHWLAALKDHAMLGLPPEFSSQLPHSGGAFYSNEAIDSVRQYYRQAWTPMLYAAALWLSNSSCKTTSTSNAFNLKDVNANNGADDNENTSRENPLPAEEQRGDDNTEVDMMTSDRFYLLLGLCVSCLCGGSSSNEGSGSRSGDGEEEEDRPETCLKALYTLLQHPLPARLLAENTPLAIEIVSLMQRQIVSSEKVSVYQLSVNIVAEIVLAATTSLSQHKSSQHQCSGHPANYSCNGCDADLAGEGGETGEINTSQSLVFAALQVCLCCLVRHEAGIAPQVVSSAPSLLTAPRTRPPQHLRDKLLADTLSLCTSLPDLCSPAGGVAILPTVLFLITGVLRECSKQDEVESGSPSSNPSVISISKEEQLTNSIRSSAPSTTSNRSKTGVRDSLPLLAVYRCLAAMCSHAYARDTRSSEQWCQLLQSALATVLDNAKTCEDERIVCESVVVRGVTEFLVHAPCSVTAPHNLRYPAINLCKSAMHHADYQVRVLCVQQIHRIFISAGTEVSSVFMQALGPRLLYQLHKTSAVTTQHQLQLFDAMMDAVMFMFEKTLPQYKVELLSVVVSLLVGCLQQQQPTTGTTANFGNLSNALHSSALERLQRLAPQYQQDFRTVMGQRSELRSKLEAAIRGEQAAVAASHRTAAAASAASAAASHNPTIKLKTDFSNFK